MIDFTIWAQSHRPSDKELPQLSKNNIDGKLYLLKMYENELRDWFKTESEIKNRKFQIKIAALSATITILLALVGNIFSQIIRDIFLTGLILEASVIIYFGIKTLLDIFDKDSREFKSIVIPQPHFFLDLLKKLKEKWYVSSISRWWPVYFSITTESDRKKYEEGKKRHNAELTKKTKNLKNPVPISEIVKNKDLYVGKKITLNCLSDGFGMTAIPNGYYNEYRLYDRTGGISAIIFKTKKHFWQKVPTLEDKDCRVILKTDFYYRLTGTWIKANNLFWLQPSKVENLISQ